MIQVRLYPYSQQLAAIKAEFANLLSKAGGVMSGPIDMDGRPITGLPETVPSSGGAAISKAVLDLAIAGRVVVENAIAADVATLATVVAGKASSAQGGKADTAVQPGADVSVLAETSTAKIMTGTERTKLAGVAAGATANDTDGNLKNRANHTGQQPIGSVANLQAALDGKATAAQGEKADTAVQPGALAAESSRAIAAEAGLDGRLGVVEPLTALVPRYDDRAGDARALFSTILTGDPLARARLAIGTLVATATAGTVLRLTGADVDPIQGYVDVAPRLAVPLYAGRTYRVTFRLARAVDPVDPANNAIELRWQNLNLNKASVSNVRLGAALTPVVANGVLTYSFLIGKAGAPGALDYTIPPTALYGLPEIRVYGNGQESYIISIAPPEDVTDTAGIDIPAMNANVSTLTSGLATEIVNRQAGDAAEQGARTAAIAVEASTRQQQTARIAGTPRVAAAHVAGGMMILLEDDVGGLFYVDPIKGRIHLHNLVLDGGEGMVAGGMMPLVRAQGGQSLLSFDLFDRRVIAEYGEMLGRPGTVDFDFLRVTEWDEAGQPLAGYEPGQRVRLHPRVLDGLTIQGDANKVPQLWAVIDSANGPTRMQRQLTFSQYGVTGYQIVQRPSGTTPGLVRIQCNDGDPIRDRHKVRHAHWPVSEPATAVPAKIVYVVVIGQSNSIGAGSYGTNPTNLKGPQTIRTAMPVRNAPFASRLLTWNGGTIPHQGQLDGDVDVGGGVLARNVPIDAARITSLVPMREGLGTLGHADGGPTRESFVTALATHLNGPNGYDGSVYLAGASFGFGSSSFAQLIHDGTSRKQAWLNALASIDQAKVIATASGLPIEVHVVIDQGEADWSNASYRAQVEAAWAIMKTDITSRTAQIAAPQLFYHQTVLARGTLREPAYSALAQVELARNNADIHLLPPHYFTDFDSDTTHYKAPEEAWRGALSGEAMADWLIRGETAALMMQSATWADTKMTVTFNHPIARDADTIVLTAGNGGFSHNNSAGTTATVSTVLIDQANQSRLIATMSGSIDLAAAETARMAYGNQGTTSPASQGFGGGVGGGGQRSVFKRADWRRYSLIDGRPLDIFASIQEIAATQEI